MQHGRFFISLTSALKGWFTDIAGKPRLDGPRLITDEAELAQEVRRHYRWNFAFNALDGTTFWLSQSFITAATILPVYVAHFTDNPFLIGLIPVLGSAAFLLPQLLTSNWVQRLPRKKVLPVNLGLFSERLPLLLLAPSAFLFAINQPALALTLFFLLYAWHSAGAGIIAVGWQDMVAKVIPEERRGFFFGLTNFGGTITGVLGASLAAWVLARYAFPTGYVIAFALASIFNMVSWFGLFMVREPAVPNRSQPVSQREFFRQLPGVLRNDHNFSRFILGQVILAFGGMGLGFLAVYAVQHWQLPDSQAGSYTAVMLVAQSAANLIFGPLADRKGHKLILVISAAFSTLTYLLANLASSPEWFYLVFALRGVSFAGMYLSGTMIAFEFSAADVRPTYIGLSATSLGLASALAPMLGGWLASWFGMQPMFAFSAGFSALGLALLLFWLREPRLQAPAKGVTTLDTAG